jgi:dienelactone hydrolase
MRARRTAPPPTEPPSRAPRGDGAPGAGLVALRALSDGLLLGAVVVSALLAVEFDFGVPRVAVALVLAFLGFAVVSAGEGLVVLLWSLLGALFRRLRVARGLAVLRAVPPVPVGRILGALVYMAGDVLWPQSFLKHLMLPAVLEIALLLAGLGAVAIALARSDGRGRAARAALLAPPAVLALAFVLWVVDPGFDGYLRAAPAAAAPGAALAAAPGAAPGAAGPYDAAARGPFGVRTSTYGSGASVRRPEYGADATFRTPSVDGSALFGGYGGWAGSFFRWYWGFDFDALPLDGLVWQPEGAGPFPLVLLVHGNHAMSVPSEPGYAYLAEHLASHGYLVAAIDQNYLNGLVFFDGGFAELPLRAWLILQHLQQWRRWNATPGHPLEGRVDLDRVALVGHSRGGEAVAWAAHLNEQPVRGVSDPGDFGFGIRGVVAIAPSDAHEGPGGLKPTLPHADYLLLAGGHDADTFLLYGQAQFARATFDDDPERFRALAYLHRANHGQFNSVWGDRDRGLFNSLLLNRAPLLPAEAQQQAAQALVTSFLHAALREEPAYRAPFANPPSGRAWGTAGLIVTQLRPAASIVVEDFEGRVGTVAGVGDARADVEALLLRDGQREQGNRALRLSWAAGSRPTYAIALAPEELDPWGPSVGPALTFALASVPGAAAPGGLVVELEAAGGATSRLAVGDGGPLVHALPAHLVKARWLYGRNGFPGAIRPEEVVLQTFTLPLADFEPSVDLAGLSAVRFAFDGAAAGAVYLDEVGLTRAW